MYYINLSDPDYNLNTYIYVVFIQVLVVKYTCIQFTQQVRLHIILIRQMYIDRLYRIFDDKDFISDSTRVFFLAHAENDMIQ